MDSKYTKYLLDPFVLTFASIILYFIPEIPLLEKWVIALIYILVVWLGSLYGFVSVNLTANAHHPGRTYKNIRDIELSRNNLDARDALLEIEISINTKAGKYLFNKLIKNLEVLARFDRNFLNITPNEIYEEIKEITNGFSIPLFGQKTEEYSYNFFMIPGEKRSGKTSGIIEFEILSLSKRKIINSINKRILLRRSKKLLSKRTIKIRIQ